MTDLDRAIAAAREALDNEAPTAEIDAVRLDGAIRDLIAAIDAARGQAVAWMTAGGDVSRSKLWCDERSLGGEPSPIYAAPPAAGRDESLIDIGGECVPRWIVDYADALTTYFAECGGRSWAIGGVQSRDRAPPAAVAVPANVTPMRQQRTDLARLVGSINAAVYSNGDGLSVTEAIGALELAKLELLREQEQ